MKFSQPTLARFFSKVDECELTGCWLWNASCGSHGYGQFGLNGSMVAAHYMSHVIHKGEPGVDMCVLHKCHTPACVNPEHLYAGTAKDNARDRDVAGRHVKGEGCHKAKLTEGKVREIRVHLAEDKITQNEIAIMYGVKKPTISSIKVGRSWRHLL